MAKAKKVKEKLPEEEKYVKVNLACGAGNEEGWIGIDIADLPGVDIVHDLYVFPWPFEDESVDEIKCEQFVEHIPLRETEEGLDLFLAFFNEIYRILKPGGKCLVVSPYYSSMRAIQDPTHRRFISEATFLYVNQEWLNREGLGHYGVTADFDYVYGYNISSPEVAGRSEEARHWALAHWMNSADDIVVNLTKR